MRWKDLVVEYLRKKQGGRCTQCGGGLYHAYQWQVRYREGINADAEAATDLDLLVLIHINCGTAAIKRSQLMALQAYHLFKNRSIQPARIAEVWGVSERTIWRAIARGKRAVEIDQDKPRGPVGTLTRIGGIDR